MRVGFFGGTFDPVHRGHLDPVEDAQRQLELDRVVYLPTGVPPHKPDREMTPIWQRLAMVELALLDKPDFVVDPFEMRASEPAYSIDTLRHFRGLMPATELFLIIGADSLAVIDTWHEWTEIPRLADLAVLVRPEWHWPSLLSDLPTAVRDLAASEKVHFIENRPCDISATDLRESLRRGEEPGPDVIPSLVLKYIQKYNLYR